MRKVVLALALIVSTIGFAAPANAGTFCADGTYSYSSGSGTCSWHGGIAGGAPSKKKSYGYEDPWGSSLGNSYGSTPKKKSYGYEDPWGSSLGNSYGSTPKKKSYGYEDPWGSSQGNSYGSTPKKNSFGYTDPWGSSLSNCSYIDRSWGRC